MPRQPPPTDQQKLAMLLGDDLVDGLLAAKDLRKLVIQQEARLVARARMNGCAWHWIAIWLGITPQAAHRRWATKTAARIAAELASEDEDDEDEED